MHPGAVNSASGAGRGLRGERMTVSEAIKNLTDAYQNGCLPSKEAFEMAIEALERFLPWKEEKKCVDVGMMSEGW